MRAVTAIGLVFGLLNGLGATAMLYGDHRSRHKYGENWDCMVLCLLGAFVFWASLPISALLLAVGALKRDRIAMVGLAGLAALFGICWVVLPR